ncbi:MAG TPA: cation-transporting P-type ATPase, partial [Armatimonadota bacterium]
MPEDRNFWERPLQELLSTLDTSPKGLTSAQAKSRVVNYGPNTLGRDSHYYALREFLRFFLNPLVLILLAASAVSISVGEVLNASIIIAMVFLSVSLNFYQEFQARRAVESLRNQVATTAEVLRDGKSSELPVASLVPGDIVILNAGDLVPADGRL